MFVCGGSLDSADSVGGGPKSPSTNHKDELRLMHALEGGGR